MTAATLVTAATLAVGSSVAGAVGTATPPGHRVVVVGDSVLLGAKSQLAARYDGAGWDATLDMAVSRSTTAGLTAIESHRDKLTDSLVIGLGTNDSGDTDAFRTKVTRVLAAVSQVPHVYWVSIAEVRPYYAAANQVLRDAAAFHPNLTVIDWAGFAGANGSVAGSDGLHLTPTGADEMANLVSFATIIGAVSPVSATPSTTAPTTPTSATTTPATTAPATTAPATTAPVTTVTPSAGATQGAPGSTALPLLGWSFGIGFTALLVALGVIAAALGAWSFVATRSRSKT